LPEELGTLVVERVSRDDGTTTERPSLIISFPFTYNAQQYFLKRNLPLDATYNLIQSENLNGLANDLKINKRVELSLDQNTVVFIQGILGQGTHGTVYLATWNSKKIAIKIYNFVDQWNYYINQLIFRLLPDANRFFVHSFALYMNDKISLMMMDYISHGTLLDCLNTFRAVGNAVVPELLTQLIILRLLQAILLIHKHRITHNDLKLDNILLNYTLLPEEDILKQTSIKIIDFDLATNIQLIAPPSDFVMMKSHPTNTDDNVPMMSTDLPWPPFHLDYWCIANCAHMLLFSTPINKTTPNKLKRYWNITLWENFFDVLVIKPPTTWDDGLLALHTLLIDIGSSLENTTVKKSIIDYLKFYDRHFKAAH
jgi:serine/threonine protein kinase